MEQGKRINVIALKELFNENTSGVLPVLADIQHDHIKWGDNTHEQEDGHLRIVNDMAAVRYKGKKYMPANFTFTLPSEDGKKISNTSITVSSIDKRMIEIIRSINSNPPVLIMHALFGKQEIEGKTGYTFHELSEYKFSMTNCSWDGVTARWDLVFDTVMQTNIPVDIGTVYRNPAVNKGR